MSIGRYLYTVHEVFRLSALDSRRGGAGVSMECAFHGEGELSA